MNSTGRLILTEAKLYSNGEIKSTSTAAVCAQLVEYHRWAVRNKQDVIAAYWKVPTYRNRLRLPSADVIPTDLDVIPRLLIFEFDSTHKAALTQIKEQILTELKVQIPNFDGRYIQTVGAASHLREHHLDGSLE